MLLGEWDSQRDESCALFLGQHGAPIFSEYYKKLEGPEKKRYKEKVYLCGFDPYTLKRSDFEDSVALFPGIEYPDIVNYLVLQTSWLTHQQMKA